MKLILMYLNIPIGHDSGAKQEGRRLQRGWRSPSANPSCNDLNHSIADNICEGRNKGTKQSASDYMEKMVRYVTNLGAHLLVRYVSFVVLGINRSLVNSICMGLGKSCWSQSQMGFVQQRRGRMKSHVRTRRINW